MPETIVHVDPLPSSQRAWGVGELRYGHATADLISNVDYTLSEQPPEMSCMSPTLSTPWTTQRSEWTLDDVDHATGLSYCDAAMWRVGQHTHGATGYPENQLCNTCQRNKQLVSVCPISDATIAPIRQRPKICNTTGVSGMKAGVSSPALQWP